VALAYWPALAALFVLAEPVALFADADMGPAIWPLRLLALATIIKAVGAAVGSVFLAKGRANWALYWSIFSLIILIPALKWGGTHGVVGVCAVIALTAVLFLALSQHLANRLMAIGFGTYLAVLWRPALVTAATGVTVLAVSPWLPTPPLLACAAGGSIAAIAWLAAIRLFAWDSVAEMVRSARGTADDPGP
jgi:O-antigen/teichoic acid export membrane protein